MEKAQLSKIVLGFAVGVVTGGGVTYLITNAKLKAKYEAILEEEIASVKDSYRVVNTVVNFSTPQEAVQQLAYQTLAKDLDYVGDDDWSPTDELEQRLSIVKSMEDEGPDEDKDKNEEIIET